MAIRSFPGTGGTGKDVHGAGLSGASTGVKLTYTCPAGSQARVLGAWVNVTAGAAEIALEASLSGATCQIQRGTASFQLVGNLSLNPGDQLRHVVNVLDAAGVFTGVICAEEYPVV